MKRKLDKFLLVAGYALAIGGGLFGAYYTYNWWEQRNASAPENIIGLPKVDVEFSTDGNTVKFTKLPEPGTEFARIHIDKLNIHLPIKEGPDVSGMSRKEQEKAGEVHLAKSAMHIKGYPWPGEIGNSLLGGHNNVTLKGFKNLSNIQKGDKIRIDYSSFHVIYEVSKDGWIVDKYDQSVMSFQTDEPILRLITCYPFDERGNAPQRYIVEAKLIERVKN